MNRVGCNFLIAAATAKTVRQLTVFPVARLRQWAVEGVRFFLEEDFMAGGSSLFGLNNGQANIYPIENGGAQGGVIERRHAQSNKRSAR